MAVEPIRRPRNQLALTGLLITVALWPLSASRGAQPQASRGGAECPPRQELKGSLKPLAEVPLDIQPAGLQPHDCFDAMHPDGERPLLELNAQRSHVEHAFHWEASLLGHNPLYFEDVPLERYGQSAGHVWQPVVSGARFLGSVPVLPYKMGLDHWREYEYTLGHVRPGNPAPHLREHLPWSWKGAALEAGAVTGAFFLFP